jgi:hypothetical protein
VLAACRLSDEADDACRSTYWRTRAGHLAWGGLHVTAGFQPYLSRDLFLGDVSVGLDAPWVWWW